MGFILLGCCKLLPLNARKGQVKELSVVLYVGCELVLLNPHFWGSSLHCLNPDPEKVFASCKVGNRKKNISVLLQLIPQQVTASTWCRATCCSSISTKDLIINWQHYISASQKNGWEFWKWGFFHPQQHNIPSTHGLAMISSSSEASCMNHSRIACITCCHIHVHGFLQVSFLRTKPNCSRGKDP